MPYFSLINTCCTGLILEGFDGNRESWVQTIRDCVNFGGYQTLQTHSLILAITTSRQVAAKAFLEEIGFVSAGPFNKDRNTAQRHRETGGLTLHHIHAADLWAWIVEQRRIRNENAEAERARQAEIDGRRRFGNKPKPGVGFVKEPKKNLITNNTPRRVPSCTIESLKRGRHLASFVRGWDQTRAIRDTARMMTTYGISYEQIATPLRANTLAEQIARLREFQRQNERAGLITIVR